MWQDWRTASGFRIRISELARDLLVRLPGNVQLQLRARLQELAELAELIPVSTEGTWNQAPRPTLQFSARGVVVRYSVSEAQRALVVERVLAGAELGSNPFGRIA